MLGVDGLAWPASRLGKDLAEQGFSVVDNPIPRENYAALGRALDELVQEVGATVLIETTQGYRGSQAGATIGYFEKLPDARGDVGKRTFTFRLGEPYTKPLPEAVRQFVDQGMEIAAYSAETIRACVEELEGDYSGLLDKHYWRRNERLRQHFDTRIVQYDHARPDQVVSSPHLDISCFSLHGYDSSPGSFYAIREHSGGPRPRMCYPTAKLGNQAVLFTGCRLYVDCREPRASSRRNFYAPVVFPDFLGTPLWHGALGGEAIGDARRTVVVSQLHPGASVRFDAMDESLDAHKNAPQHIMAALSADLMRLYSESHRE